MANRIKIRRGSGTPTTSNTEAYELAYDYSADILYIHDGASNTMVPIGGGGDADTLDGLDSTQFLRSDADDETSGELTAAEFIGPLRGPVKFTAKADVAITKGDAVYVSGISGNTPTVDIADANDSNKMPAFGIAQETVSANASIEIITFGDLSNINTFSYEEGDVLYVSTSGTTGNTLTATPPSGESSLIQNIGKVLRRDSSVGRIKVGGAGRSNATPNLNQDKIFLGNASNQAVSTALSSIGLSKFNNDSGYLTSFDITTQTDPKYLRSDTADTATGLLTLNGGVHILSGTGGGKLRIKRNSSSTDGDDIVDLHLDDFGLYVDLDNDNDSDQSEFKFRYKTGGSFTNLLAFNSSSISYKGNTIPTISNMANDRIVTGSSSTTMRGENNLTFNGSTLSLTGALTASSTITTNYGVSFTNGNTNFIIYNNTGDDLIYLRDTTNGQMLQTWTTSSTTMHKNLSVSGNVNATGDINVSDDVILNVNANYIYLRDASGTLTRTFGMNSANTTYIGPIDAYAGGSVVYGISSNVLAHYFYTDGAIRMKLDGPVLDIPNTGDWSSILNNTNSGGLRLGTKDSGGTLAYQIELSNTGNYVKLNEDVQLPATKKLYLDGGGNTYITEEVADQITLRAGGGNYFKVSPTNGVVVNDPGANVDFRVEGDTNTHLLFTDASTDRVGIGTASPADKLHVYLSGSGTGLRLEGAGGQTAIRYQNDAQSWYTGINSAEQYYWYSSQLGATWGFINTDGNLYNYYNYIATTNDRGYLGRDSGGTVRTVIKIDSGNSILLGDSNLTGQVHAYPSQYLQVNSDAGWIQVGPKNSGWGHIETDRASFYFNKKLTVDEGIVQSYDEDLSLRRAQSTNDRIDIADNDIRFIADGTERFAANQNGLDLGASSANKIVHNNTSTRDKIRVWTSASYAIGMQSSFTFGGLENQYAMTFQMNNQSSERGFWWGDDGHNQAQGAMALTTAGELTVADSIRVGYGESDTTTPGASYKLDVSGNSLVTGTMFASTLQTDSGNLNLSGGGWGMNFYIDTDANSGDNYNFYSDNALRHILGGDGNVTFGKVSNPTLSIMNTGTAAGNGPTLEFGHDQGGGSRAAAIKTYLTDGSISNRTSLLRFHHTQSNVDVLKLQLGDNYVRQYQKGDTSDYLETIVNDDHVDFHVASGNYVKISTDHGYLQIGPQNTSHCHYTTDRSNHWFNTRVVIEGGTLDSYNEDLTLRRASSNNDRIVIEADQHSHYVNGSKKLEVKSTGIVAQGNSQSSTYFQCNQNGTTLKRYVSTWNSAVRTQDVLLNAYQSTLGDYVYLKASGNTSTTHGMLLNSDNYLFWGRADVVEGGVTNSATAPIADVCMRVDSSGNALFDGDVVAYSTTIASDARLKENVKDLNYGLKDVLDIRPVSFDWIDKRNGQHDIGVIAQEIEKIIPEVVVEVDTLNSEDTHKTVDYAKLTSVLIKAVQEQQQQINELKEKLNG